jgi:hypothetical protein
MPPMKMPPNALSKEGSAGRGAVAAGEDRRRSQRVMLRVSVLLDFMADGQQITLEAHTVAVNIHGAMVCASRTFPANARVGIQHKLSGERMSGRVTRQPQSTPEGFLIPVEFDKPSTEFWHVSFPPSDWKPPDA